MTAELDALALQLQRLQRLSGTPEEANKTQNVALPQTPAPVGDRCELASQSGLACINSCTPVRTLIESLNHPFMVINVDDYSIALANSAARTLATINARHCHELSHQRAKPCGNADHPCPLEILKRTGQHVRVEHLHADEHGRLRNIEVHAHPVFDEAGRLVQMIEYCLDITERRAAEASLIETRDLTVFALAKLAESRDPETGQHLERMRAYSMILADQLRVSGTCKPPIDQSFMADLYRASPLHDIGKVGIPDHVLLKPGHLTDAEFNIMKQHVVLGASALREIIASTRSASFLTMALEIAQAHHERYNGQGYPSGLVGEAIPLAARIVAVADVFDALSSARVYKPAFEPSAARAMILAERGEHFDPCVVDAFDARFDEILAVREHANSVKPAN